MHMERAPYGSRDRLGHPPPDYRDRRYDGPPRHRDNRMYMEKPPVMHKTERYFIVLPNIVLIQGRILTTRKEDTAKMNMHHILTANLFIDRIVEGIRLLTLQSQGMKVAM